MRFPKKSEVNLKINLNWVQSRFHQNQVKSKFEWKVNHLLDPITDSWKAHQLNDTNLFCQTVELWKLHSLIIPSTSSVQWLSNANVGEIYVRHCLCTLKRAENEKLLHAANLAVYERSPQTHTNALSPFIIIYQVSTCLLIVLTLTRYGEKEIRKKAKKREQKIWRLDIKAFITAFASASARVFSLPFQ